MTASSTSIKAIGPANDFGVAASFTAQLVRLGHQRWDIENRGFNELVNGWHADHIYKHEPHAIETVLLTTFLAFNLYHAFVARNLKPSLRRGKPRVFWARVMAAELYQAATGPSP